jgi:hypothetical protein
MRKLTILAAIFAGRAPLMWLLPQREIETRLKLEKMRSVPASTEVGSPKRSPVICPVHTPCQQDGRPPVDAMPGTFNGP